MAFDRLNLLFFIFLSFLGVIAGLVYSKFDVELDKQILDHRLNELFYSKYSISDGSQTGYSGGYYDSYRLHYTLHEEGFYLCELTKESGGYVKFKRRSADLYFNYPEVTWVPDKFVFGYHMPGTGCYKSTYRPLPENCYLRIFNDNLKGTVSYKVESYTPGKLSEIRNFPATYFSKYYFVAQMYHPSEFYYNKYFEQTSSLDACQVKINCEKSFYSISSNDNAIITSTCIHAALGFFIGILLTLFTSVIRKVWMKKGRR